MASTYSETVGNGTLTYTVAADSGTCYFNQGDYHQPESYTIWQFSGFSYKDSTGMVTGLSGSGEYIQSPGGSSCPPPGAHPAQITLGPAFGFDLVFETCPADYCFASYNSIPHGYIDPKYVVTSVTYAPPGGPGSYVEYGSEQDTGNQISSSASFSSSSSFSESSSISWGITKAYAGGTFATNWGTGDSSTTSNTEAIGQSATFITNMKNAEGYSTASFPIAWSGFWHSGFNPHDYDLVWLWLNAVEPYNAPSAGSVTWFGYGWDACDPVDGIEQYNLYVGNLDGKIALTDGDKTTIARSWATGTGSDGGVVPSNCDGQSFASGSGPAINQTTDFANLAASDPLVSEGYALDLQGNGITTGDGRYTRFAGYVSNGQVTPPTTTDLIFRQVAPEQSPTPITGELALTSSSDVGQSQTYSYSQTFGTDNSFNSSMWLINFKESLQTSNTITNSYTTKENLTTATSIFANFNILPPSCTVVNGACDPVYNGPTEFDIYQDNKFGTFMFWPLNGL